MSNSGFFLKSKKKSNLFVANNPLLLLIIQTIRKPVSINLLHSADEKRHFENRLNIVNWVSYTFNAMD